MNQSESEIRKLADYLLENYDTRIGGGYTTGESAVETAIKLLEEYKPIHEVWTSMLWEER